MSAPKVPRCRGTNYHVFALGAAKCSMCGYDRYPAATSAPVVSAPEPTAEHKRTAARLVDIIYDRGTVADVECRAAETLIVTALAAAEARGRLEMARECCVAAGGSEHTAAGLVDPVLVPHLIRDLVSDHETAAEARGFERGAIGLAVLRSWLDDHPELGDSDAAIVPVGAIREMCMFPNPETAPKEPR